MKSYERVLNSRDVQFTTDLLQIDNDWKPKKPHFNRCNIWNNISNGIKSNVKDSNMKSSKLLLVHKFIFKWLFSDISDSTTNFEDEWNALKEVFLNIE